MKFAEMSNSLGAGELKASCDADEPEEGAGALRPKQRADVTRLLIGWTAIVWGLSSLDGYK